MVGLDAVPCCFRESEDWQRNQIRKCRGYLGGKGALGGGRGGTLEQRGRRGTGGGVSAARSSLSQEQHQIANHQAL